jgi:hypothetical protein
MVTSDNRGARLLLELAIGVVLLGIILLPRWMNRPAARPAIPAIEHIVLIVLPGGHATETIVRGAAARGVLLTNAHALAHPALPNRIALVSGGAWGIRDAAPSPLAVRHLGDLCDAQHRSWGVFADDAARVPFASFANPPPILPLSQLDAARLPAFAYVAATSVPQRDWPPHTLRIITIDEGRGATNDILIALAGDGVNEGTTSRAWYDHYSVLRTIEETFHLGTLTEHDAKAVAIDDVWR